MVMVLSMGSESESTKSCINPLCYFNLNNMSNNVVSSNDIGWKKGWALRSGSGFADLCHHCGSAYENSIYCDLFHLQQSGWRECHVCHKSIHCGCIASSALFDLLDAGGIICLSCKRNPAPELSPPSNSNEKSGNDGEKLLQLCSFSDTWESDLFSQLRKNAPLGGFNPETMHANGEASLNLAEQANPSFVASSKSPDLSTGLPLKLNDGSKLLPPSFSLGAPASSSNLLLPFSSCTREGSEKGVMTSSSQQETRSLPILSKLQKPSAPCSKTSKTVVPQARIARPPAEGRGRNQLLPRYWPKITDQELQKISGDLNSNVVPLFEKTLSASDAGRIGRLVVPKACAEAYFPPISQSEGVPVKIQDVKGNEWTFQFRFWPNNNSRMYVLEGVTPCIQSMQLQAGDIVTFSRIDPSSKLVMGFRKAGSVNSQENQASNFPSESLSMEASFSNNGKSLLPVDDYTQFLPSVSESKDTHLSSTENIKASDGKVGWHKTGNQGTGDDLSQFPLPLSEKKKTRNIGSKNRRLLMHNDDVMELRLTWEEAQDLLRPPPSIKPSIVTIEGHDFEEYDEAPVFGKRTLYACQPSGEQEQWAQCDGCSKWRRLHLDVLLPPRWTCSDNVWDSARQSCSAPEEAIPKELGDSQYRMNRGTKKKRRVIENRRETSEHETSGLDALASAAILGDFNTGESSVGVTTKHPRHRPGCTCIVCIQPPSGKGKHKSTCTCNVCMTVKRRFKTLMLRKKKRQSEHEAGTIAGERSSCNDESGTNETSADALKKTKLVENGESQREILAEVAEISNGCIDLNSHPDRDNLAADAQRPDVADVVQAVQFPLEKYLPESGMGNPHFGQTTSTISHPLLQSNVEDIHQPDEEYNASEVRKNNAAHNEV